MNQYQSQQPVNRQYSDIFNQQGQQQTQHVQQQQYSNNQRQSNIFSDAPARPDSNTGKKSFQQARQGFNPITGKLNKSGDEPLGKMLEQYN